MPDAPSYEANHLAGKLRAPSLGREETCFAVLAEREGRAEITYGALFGGAEQHAEALVAAGLQPGDRVAVQVEKSIEALQLYLGTVLAGGVFLPLNTAYTAAEVSYFLSDAEPRVFVCDPAKLDRLQQVADGADVGRVFTLSAAGAGSLSAAVAEQTAGFEAVARGEEDLGAILYTSGTTGRSKGAMLTHGNLASNAEVLKDYWQFTEDDVLIHALPIFHTHGLFVATNVTLMAGGRLIFRARFDAEAILGDMAEATAMMGVPTFYVRLLDCPGLTQEATAGMRVFISGSAPLLAETHKLWAERTGHQILERYGMTETGMNTSNPYDAERRAGTVGFPLPGVEIRITDAAKGEALATGEVGAIEVRGPNVFKGYWRMPEKTREELRDDGFFITGDLGQIDERGYVSIVGRSKDLIISGGYNIYPKEIEAMIDAVAGVRESAVIGLPHPDFGEGVAAVVVPEAQSGLSGEAVSAALKDDLARFKQPKRVFLVEELPRNTMGKVQKNLLRDRYKDAFAAAPDARASGG